MMIVMVAMIVMVVTMLFDDDSDGDDDNDGGGDVVATSWLPPCQGWPRPPPPTQQGSSSTFNEITLVNIIINSGGQLFNPKMIFNEVAFVIYCIHSPSSLSNHFSIITSTSLTHHSTITSPSLQASHSPVRDCRRGKKIVHRNREESLEIWISKYSHCHILFSL